MTQIDIVYEGKLHTSCTHLKNQKKIHTDAPLDHEGKGEEFSPTDLVATALGSCILTIMGIYANLLGVDIEGTSARVEKIMKTSPRTIAKIKVAVDCPKPIAESYAQQLEEAAMQCPVHHSLHPDIEQDITFKWRHG